eukprot:CAMPEP_0194525060 /NCGR_PEP_ID=MMETSP0253-20130528/60397_1 /TAXON_ID=2966 /ORGANISM="Noctiluca scintillans" /LENGTH=211 /DNA_ID=CAMNT_0039369751 /DNA_START=7 /DNA_END=639 /DNA_ORIENTATION=-
MTAEIETVSNANFASWPPAGGATATGVAGSSNAWHVDAGFHVERHYHAGAESNSGSAVTPDIWTSMQLAFASQPPPDNPFGVLPVSEPKDETHAEWAAAVSAGVGPLPPQALGHCGEVLETCDEHVARLECKLAKLTAPRGRTGKVLAADFKGLAAATLLGLPSPPVDDPWAFVLAHGSSCQRFPDWPCDEAFAAKSESLPLLHDRLEETE